MKENRQGSEREREVVERENGGLGGDCENKFVGGLYISL